MERMPIADPSKILEAEFRPYDPNAMKIVALFLEKYEMMTADERREILFCIKCLNHPPMVVFDGKD